MDLWLTFVMDISFKKVEGVQFATVSVGGTLAQSRE